LQPTKDCSDGYVFIVVVHQSYLALEMVDIAHWALPGFILTTRRWLLFL